MTDQSFSTAVECAAFIEPEAREHRPVEPADRASAWAGVDAALLDACVQGNALAWRRLHRACYPRAAAFLRKLGVRELELDDAAQEVFVQLFRYLPRFRREAELSTWLFRLCITQARSVRRRRRLSGALSQLLSLSAPASFVSTPSLPDEVARRRVEAALAKLSDGDRTVFVLYEMEGLPGKRIAEIVSSPEASVWRRLHDARRKFCAALENDPDLTFAQTT